MANLIDLSKKAKITLEKKGVFGEKVNVALALDISASMTSLFDRGVVQEVVERILAIGMNMDSNKEIDVYLFGSDAHGVGTVSEGTINGYVKNTIRKNYRLESSTRYAGVMSMIAKDFTGFEGAVKAPVNVKPKGLFGKLFGKKEDKPEVKPGATGGSGNSKDATIVFFITDGDNFDKSEAERFMKEVSGNSIFWQFVGVGNAGFTFLEKLDDMGGRVVDNANFFQLNDISRISDEELYDRILNEFPMWLKESRAKGITN